MRVNFYETTICDVERGNKNGLNNGSIISKKTEVQKRIEREKKRRKKESEKGKRKNEAVLKITHKLIVKINKFFESN